MFSHPCRKRVWFKRNLSLTVVSLKDEASVAAPLINETAQ